jgi:hypothetical protein
MATPAAKSRRRAVALNRLSELSARVAEKFGVEVPDLQVTNRDPELAQIQKMEAMADLLEGVLGEGAEESVEPERGEIEPVEAPKAVKKAARKAATKKAASKRR